MKLRPHIAKQLKKAEVEVIDIDSLRLRCTKCKKTWSPTFLPGKRLPRRYWQCPNGCNVKK